MKLEEGRERWLSGVTRGYTTLNHLVLSLHLLNFLKQHPNSTALRRNE